MRKGVCIIAVLLFLALAGLSFAAPNMEDGLWEMTMTMEMPGVPSKSFTHTSCLTKEKAVPQTAESSCTLKDVKTEGDTVTLPEMGDRFKLAEIDLDTARIAVTTACRFGGTIRFAAPRRDTLAVTWVGTVEQALIYGWPADLGPFGGLGVTVHGDTLRGALLFDSRLGVQVRPGVTAQFVARRALSR